MNMKKAEEIANNPDNISGDLRKEAFHWADGKRNNERLSEEFRKRAKVVVLKLLEWAQSQIKKPKVFI